MLERIRELLNEVEALKAATREEVEELRIKYISKKGKLNQLFAEFKDVQPELKKEVGKALNDLKIAAQEKINALKAAYESDGVGK
ncbi:MAG TPA: phenylalanine--tRNA ligase subunit alpha, partial [Prolixibacteraceae bacterium]|nr:phenylalanine--tRNA ligase subunit alpha [Prolixibacteraceae bacterium]